MLGLRAGAFDLLMPEQLTGPVLSTHFLPLRIFCSYLEEATKAKVALLAIQPKDVSFGEGLTTELMETAKRLKGILIQMLSALDSKGFQA